MRIKLEVSPESAKDNYHTKEIADLEIAVTADLVPHIVAMFSKALEVHLQNRVQASLLNIQPDQTASRHV